jgi:hypothetical protein
LTSSSSSTAAAPANPEPLAFSYADAPTLARFARSDAALRGLMGPFGSGKSSACCWEILRRASAQAPGPDGVRRSRCAVIRNTKPQLQDTTLKTWFDWFPDGVAGTWRLSDYTYWLRLGDATTGRLAVECEVVFRALDILKHVRNLLSLELTFAWVNEAREIGEEVVQTLQGRVNRYPARKDGGPTWSGVWLDTNPPDDLSWWYRLFEEDRPPHAALFRQPSARGPEAENTAHLPAGYYDTLRLGKDDQYLKVYIDGEYGFVEEGRPIYKGQFSDRLHVADQELWPLKGQPIYLGWDFGTTPALVIAQLTPRGQLRVLDEVQGENMGIRQLIRAVKPLLDSKYADLPIEASRADPAGGQRSQTDHTTPFQILEEEGLPVEAAPSNKPSKRFEWVRHWLMQLADGQPTFLLSPTCRYLRRGFNGGYRLRRLQVSGAERRYAELPDKNIFSHTHEALQYLASALAPGDERRPPPPRVSHEPVDRVAGV